MEIYKFLKQINEPVLRRDIKQALSLPEGYRIEPHLRELKDSYDAVRFSRGYKGSRMWIINENNRMQKKEA